MSKNIEQIFVANPVSTISPTDLIYIGQSGTTDAAITGSNYAKQIQQSAFNFGADSGSTNLYAVTLSPAITSYTNGLIVMFLPNSNNTSASPTLSVNGLTPHTIASNLNGGSVLNTADLNQSLLAICQFNGNFWFLLNQANTIPTQTQVQQSSFNKGLDSGAADVYAVTLSPIPLSYINGLQVAFTPTHTSVTTTPTLNVNGLGAITMTSVKAGTALSAGAIATTQICLCVYSSAANKFLVITPAA